MRWGLLAGFNGVNSMDATFVIVSLAVVVLMLAQTATDGWETFVRVSRTKVSVTVKAVVALVCGRMGQESAVEEL